MPSIFEQVVGVPVTLNGDLKNQFVEIIVGFDTICKVGIAFTSLCIVYAIIYGTSICVLWAVNFNYKVIFKLSICLNYCVWLVSTLNLLR
jgi:hypothetical protein